MAQVISVLSGVVWYIAIAAPVILAIRNIWFSSSLKRPRTSAEGESAKPALSRPEGLFFLLVVLAVLAGQILSLLGVRGLGVDAGSDVFVFGWTFIGQYLSALVLFRTDWDCHATAAVAFSAAIFAFVVLWCAVNGSLPLELRAALRALAAFASVCLVLYRCNWFIRER